MSVAGKGFKALAGFFDKHKKVILPEDIEKMIDIPYGNDEQYHLLDIYYPKEINKTLPIIINIHGGGYVYGTKEVYKNYGCFMASQGFVFVNPNYHLAPIETFPTQLNEINQVMQWVLSNKGKYHMDTSSIFLVGDSVGAQMISHYCAIYANKEFASLFDFEIPKDLHIKAIALNCGLYDISPNGFSVFNSRITAKTMFYLLMDYLGKKFDINDPRLFSIDAINENFPPSFILTSYYDVLKDASYPLYQLLQKKGIHSKYYLIGTRDQRYLRHVFHINISRKESRECNILECEFFRSFI